MQLQHARPLTSRAELFVGQGLCKQSETSSAQFTRNCDFSAFFQNFGGSYLCMYALTKTMKLVSRSLSLRPFALARLPTRLPLSTNTIPSQPSTLNLTSHSTFSTMPPPPPAKRKWPRRNGGERSNGANTPTTPITPRTAVAQQPKRPKVEDTLPKADGTIDVRQMYSTAAGDAAPKPFSDLSNKLNKGLLDGLEKMGFE